MKILTTSLLALCLLGASARAFALDEVAENPNKPVQIDSSSHPLYFPGILSREIRRGSARIALRVDDMGNLKDHLVLAYTNKAFADEIQSKISQWKFKPAMRNGAPVSIITELQVEFDRSGNIEVMTVSEMAGAFLSVANQPRMVFAPVSLKDLDGIPVPVKTVRPAFPADLVKASADGEVRVAFYIDETGQVRMPAVLKADNMDLASYAVEALLQWRFEAPRSKGSPVLVKALQVFKFKDAVTP